MFNKKNKWETIGDGLFVCCIPSSFVSKMEDNGTLVFYNPMKSEIYYRISFISFSPEDEKDAGKKQVEEDIVKKNLMQKKIGPYTVAVSAEKQIENDSCLIKFWEFGIENNIIVLSVTFPGNEIKKVKKIEIQMESIIKTIRVNEHSGLLLVDGNEIKYKEKIRNRSQQLRDLTQDEKGFIDSNIVIGKKIVDLLAMDDSGENELKILDKAFRKWLDGTVCFSDNEIVSGLGALFGATVQSLLSMEWKVLTDEYGTDFCLVHKKSNTMIFPISSVCKRVESRERDFFWDIYQIAKNRIDTGA